MLIFYLITYIELHVLIDQVNTSVMYKSLKCFDFVKTESNKINNQLL